MTGVGTLTYYDPATGRYGALGHGISDETSGVLMPLRDGSVLSAVIADARPGGHGTAGELVGSFDPGNRIGGIERNCLFGIFGTLDAPPDGNAVETASADAVKTGGATILSTVAGEDVRAYTVDISRVYHDGGCTRFLITVTDPDLLAATGGIVQGMSGSPILQDGRLIGAVTHVLLADPAKGYGVSIDDMLAASAAQDKAA
ncbi:spoIVB peptidase [Firmicutes bacterium CAG:103]|nr:spoIVB peptidase [Firmicutes bacterium CAG:103]